MLLTLQPREAPSQLMATLAPIVAVVLAAAGAAVLFAVLGRDPVACLVTLFISPLDSPVGVAELALKATPLLLCALGIAVGVRANVWNIGAEGQFIAGACAGGAVALFAGIESDWVMLPAMLVAGVLGGMGWAGIAAFLRTRFNAHEILVTLMLNYVAIQVLGWLVDGPWRDPQGFNFPQTPQFGEAAVLPALVEGTRVTIAAGFAVAAVALVSLLQRRTVVGYRLVVAGLAPGAARYAGFSEAGAIWFCLLLGGGLAGLAGICEVAGPIGQLLPSISPGYGYAAIIVAFLGRLRPLGILVASLLMALLYLGAESLQVSQQLPLAAASVIQGLLLFFLLAADVLITHRVGVRLRG